jgi:hypothetical protein
MLQRAATLQVSSSSGTLTVRVINETGHKLPSGYPEGRRIWLDARFFNSNGSLIGQSGAYDAATATLNHEGAKVYEVKLGMTPDLAEALGLPAGESFHFVLNNYVVKDNRIPPRGFSNANFAAIQSPPVGYSYADGQYWDDTTYAMPSGTVYAEVRLYYQTLSREYVEFLRDENRTNDSGNRLYQAWSSAGKSAPELMALATWGELTDAVAPSAPAALTATAASRSQINLKWNPASDNIGVAGYYIARDGVNVATATTTSYSDKGLKANTTYCYLVQAFDQAGNVSQPSNQACAKTPKR